MNSLEMFRARVRRVFPLLDGLSPLLEKRFLHPYRSYSYPDIPFLRSDGTCDNLKAWLVFWWNPWGSITPSKGGVRLDPKTNYIEAATLAGGMFIKNELIGVPWGGAKFCIKEPTPPLDNTERKRAIRAAINAVKDLIGTKYLPGPDLGTGDLIGIMVDEFAKHSNKPWVNPLHAFTGKPEALLGLRIRRDSTGLGAAYGIERLMEERLTGRITTLKNKRIVCQGFGQVVRPFVSYMQESRNAKITAVVDVSATLYREDGIDIQKLIESVGGKMLADIKFEGEYLPSEAVFTIPSDVFILGARENQLTAQRAKKLDTLFAAEIANHPTTLAAEEILRQRGIPLAPDCYINSGGVSVSYDEVIQGDHWGDEYQIGQQLKKSMHVAADQIVKVMRSESVESIRDAAIAVALRKAIARHKARGADFQDEGM